MSDYSQAIVLSENELKDLLHPTEKSRFYLALLVALPMTIAAVILMFISMGAILVLIGMIVFLAWVVMQMIKANLIGGSVRVSPDNFTEIYDLLEEVKFRLNYKDNVDVYIAQEGSNNAFLYKFFQTKFIVLDSEIVNSMPIDSCREQMTWVIGRFVGALKAKHLRFTLLSLVINSIEKIKIFNLLILPYERATQYSGDQIGMALCDDLENPIIAFNKLLVGKDLAKRVQLKGLLNQANELHSSFLAGYQKNYLRIHI